MGRLAAWAATLRAYLDNAATTPVRPEAARAMQATWGEDAAGRLAGAFANPSAVYAWGLAAAAAVDGAREAVARAWAVAARDVVFTSGATEANHLAIVGLCRARARVGRHLLTSPLEHDSVRRACAALRAEGWEIAELPVSAEGLLGPEEVAAAVRPDTVLCTFAHVNNELGVVQPVRAIAAALRRAGAALGARVALHVDGVQALGKVPVPYGLWGVDLASASAHKVGGPKGVGALLVRGVRIVPPVGGEQEGGLRPGTENVPGIVGFGAAVRLACGLPGRGGARSGGDAAEGGAAARGAGDAGDGWTGRAAGGGEGPEGPPPDAARLRGLKLRLVAGLRAALPALVVNGPDPAMEAAAPHIVNLGFDRVTRLPAEVILHALEAEGIACSAGSACSARRPEPSHVLLALGVSPARQRGSLRFSLGWANTPEEVDWAVARIPAALAAADAGWAVDTGPRAAGPRMRG